MCGGSQADATLTAWCDVPLGGALIGVRGGTAPRAACWATWAGSAAASPAALVRGDSGSVGLVGPQDRESAFTRMKDVAFFLGPVEHTHRSIGSTVMLKGASFNPGVLWGSLP